jgi:hypothetical protein
MCWNAEISLNTFIFGCISAIIVYLLGYFKLKIILIILSFTSIQLLEYFLWKNINDKKINELLSKIGLILIFFQIFLLCYFDKNNAIFLYLYSLIIIIFIIFELKNVKFETVVGENGHLSWLWLDFNIYWLIIILSFYIITNMNLYKIQFYFITITLIISFYYYYQYKTWGTMWCYLSNIIWIYLIIYSIIIKIMDI